MTANFGNEIFEVGTTFRKSDIYEIELCKCGYHFCLNLEDLLGYRKVCTRFFKVKALVRKSDYENYGQLKYGDKVDKLISRAIILTEEIPFEILIEKSSKWKAKYEQILVKNDADYNKLISMFQTDMDFSAKNWFLSIFNERVKPLLEANFSPILTQIFTDEALSKCTTDSTAIMGRVYKTFNSNKFKEIMFYIEGLLKTEGMSKDMQIYLISKKFEIM